MTRTFRNPAQIFPKHICNLHVQSPKTKRERFVFEQKLLKLKLFLWTGKMQFWHFFSKFEFNLFPETPPPKKEKAFLKKASDLFCWKDFENVSLGEIWKNLFS